MGPRCNSVAGAAAVVVFAGALVVAGCGDDEGTAETLPPIRTTTSTSTTTTTVPTEAVEYEIQSGETLGIIAEKNGVSVEQIVAFNELEGNGDYIQAGQVIRIPPPSYVPPSTTTTTVDPSATTSAPPS
jgi:LysM repeat protein